VRLLAGREHSRAELFAKLVQRGFSAAGLEPVLDHLARRGLQSDARFAEQFLAARMRRGSGPLRIRAELRQRGVAEDLIARELDIEPEAWLECLRLVYERKYGSAPAGDRKELARRIRFMESRGFGGELIQRLLRER
jgi:regulatory protein